MSEELCIICLLLPTEALLKFHKYLLSNSVVNDTAGAYSQLKQFKESTKDTKDIEEAFAASNEASKRCLCYCLAYLIDKVGQKGGAKFPFPCNLINKLLFNCEIAEVQPQNA